MSTIVTMAFPPNLQSFAVAPLTSGVPTNFNRGSTGLISVETSQFNLDVFLDAGFTLAAFGTTAQRPTGNLAVGQQYFDSTLGKPIWRNAANTGWVDATGTAA